MKSPRNIPASVRQRLLNLARSDGRPFNELLQYFAMERFLYRLSQSDHADKFILKGALMLKVWHASEFRPTMDIDMLGKTNNQQDRVAGQIRDILAVDVPPDGLVFDSDAIRAESITEGADYEGIRIRFTGALEAAKFNMSIDIGFGDVVYPSPEESELPSLLNFPAPQLLCYSRESSIAEKFEAMVKLGKLNSRMKDFYDIWLLSRHFDLDESRLARAIHLTFKRRGTEIPDVIDAFADPFITSRQTQWSAFRKKLRQENVPASFGEIVKAVDELLMPIAATLNQPH
jgi:predicted nucleotidyltransferase component of viral defense system